MNLLTWPERLISRLTGENEEEKTMTEPTQTQNAGIAAAIGYDIPRDRFESAVFLATSDTKAHG